MYDVIQFINNIHHNHKYTVVIKLHIRGVAIINI